MKPVVSINLCCYNSEKYLRETLQSVVSQTYKNWELVIVNDGSSDLTESIIFEFKDQGYPIVYHFQQNRGLVASRNKAVELSQGDYIAFIDHDDLWMPDMLASHLAAFDEETILVYGDFIIKDMSLGRDYVAFDSSKELYSGSVAEKLCKKNFIWLQSVLVRADAVRMLGEAFDPELLTAEDFDFLLRLSIQGNFKYTGKTAFTYRVHQNNLTASKRHYFAHDFSYMLKKYKNKINRRMLTDLAKQYLLTIRVDLYHAGFRFFPFLRLGFNVKHLLVSLILPFFRDKDILAIKADLLRPLRLVRSFLRRQKNTR